MTDVNAQRANAPTKDADDRRDSPRIQLQLWVRDLGRANPTWEERSGNVSLGGAFWRGQPLSGERVEIRWGLPDGGELTVRAEIIRAVSHLEGTDYHARFIDMDVKDELSLARFLQRSTSQE